MPLVLDTHALIWLVDGREGVFSAAMLERIERAARKSEVLIPAIVFWEIAMLDARGRIQLSRSCIAWCEQVQARPGVSIVPLTPAISIDSTRLPGNFHSDPADRMIVATARAENAVLLSNDQKILDYAATGSVRSVALLAG
ncbi:MAG: type II toxin-antitoxin system VapC family toxin [Gammaproteobacteria bacterium]|nr:type II toxin-antitoxin system VapC family toxin [Gammaproteobacteria bacterium]